MHWISDSQQFMNGLLSSFTLIGLAELGDKSQLVCMTLALRYRSLPVFVGATVAFSVLNVLAILLGVVVIQWIPQIWLATIVGVLFLVFGGQNFYQTVSADAPQDIDFDSHSHKSILLTTVVLLSLAELGDKTQIAVAALATHLPSVSVWPGATSALVLTSALAIWFGKKLPKIIPICTLHRLSGVLFMLMGISLLMVTWS